MKLNERTRSMQRFFDEKASGYDEVHAKLMDTKLALCNALPTHCKRLLDLGIGTGLELFAVFEKIPDAYVTGIDISGNMLEILATRPFYERVHVICGDYFEVDFGEGYDAVISSSSLHHFSSADKAVLYRKIFCALHPGGYLINTDCIASTDEEEREAFRIYEEQHNVIPHIDTPLSVFSERRILAACGFTDITFTDLDNPRYKLAVAKKPLDL